MRSSSFPCSPQFWSRSNYRQSKVFSPVVITCYCIPRIISTCVRVCESMCVCMYVCMCVCNACIVWGAVLYVIFWKDPKLSAVVLGGILVTLLTLTLNTFIHTMVLFLLSFLVVSLTYIVIKIALDSFYNRRIKNPFK